MLQERRRRRNRLLLHVCSLIIGLLLHAIALVAPHWESASSPAGQSHSGLWWLCINDNCAQFITHNTWGWFQCVQTSFLLSLFCQLAVVCIWTARWLRMLPDQHYVTWAAGAVLPGAAGALSLVTVIIYGSFQGAGEDWDTLSWAFAVAVLASVWQFITAGVFIVQAFFPVHNLKVNATPLISPAGSMMSLDDTADGAFVPDTIISDADVRMRVNSSCTAPIGTPVPVHKARSFSFNVQFTEHTFDAEDL